MEQKLTIAIAGTGYVGLSNAVLLAQHNRVWAVDVLPEKVELINQRKSPIRDKEIEEYLAAKELDLTATTDGEKAYAEADFVIISTPTNYDPKKNYFDTSSVEAVIEMVLQVNPKAVMIVKSTVPVGYTASVRKDTGRTGSCSARSFCGRDMRCMITSILPVSCGGFPRIMRNGGKRRSGMWSF